MAKPKQTEEPKNDEIKEGARLVNHPAAGNYDPKQHDTTASKPVDAAETEDASEEQKTD